MKHGLIWPNVAMFYLYDHNEYISGYIPDGNGLSIYLLSILCFYYVHYSNYQMY